MHKIIATTLSEQVLPWFIRSSRKIVASITEKSFNWLQWPYGSIEILNQPGMTLVLSQLNWIQHELMKGRIPLSKCAFLSYFQVVKIVYIVFDNTFQLCWIAQRGRIKSRHIDTLPTHRMPILKAIPYSIIDFIWGASAVLLSAGALQAAACDTWSTTNRIIQISQKGDIWLSRVLMSSAFYTVHQRLSSRCRQ